MQRNRKIRSSGVLFSLLLAGCTGIAPSARMPTAEGRLAGSILSVNVRGKSLQLTDKGVPHEVFVSPEVTIRSGQTPRSLAELRRGDRIVIVSRDEEQRATWIAVSGPPLKRPVESEKE
jgi:hypothetical protein